MKSFLRILFIATAVFLPALDARPTWQNALSEQQFMELARELSYKVTLFHKVWASDPNAEFFGGTVRDYLFWLKRQFKDARSPDEVRLVQMSLRNRPVIDVKEFILPNSDVDILSRQQFGLAAKDYGVSRIDVTSATRLDPKTPEGKSEVDQGFIPAEKIGLTASGVTQHEQFGNGAREIYQGKYTAKFSPPEVFNQTEYAKNGMNHPTLLALRLLRLLSMEHASTSFALDAESRWREIAPTTRAIVEKIFDEARRDPKFREMLQEPKFLYKVNEAVQKGFGSFVSPDMTLQLFRLTGALKLISSYSTIKSVNQHLFTKERDPQKVAAAFDEYKTDPKTIFEPVGKFFPDGYLYHGTPTTQNFRSILTAGIRPSVAGLAGEGLYGADANHISVAAGFTGEADLIVKFPVASEAKLANLWSDKVADLYERYHAKEGGDYDAFADKFGIDILRYSMQDNPAYVVKNAASVGTAKGHSRSLRTYEDLARLAREAVDNPSFHTFFKEISSSEVDGQELPHLLVTSPYFTRFRENGTTPRQMYNLLNKKGFSFDAINETLKLVGVSDLQKDLDGIEKEIPVGLSATHRRDLASGVLGVKYSLAEWGESRYLGVEPLRENEERHVAEVSKLISRLLWEVERGAKFWSAEEQRLLSEIRRAIQYEIFKANSPFLAMEDREEVFSRIFAQERDFRDRLRVARKTAANADTKLLTNAMFGFTTILAGLPLIVPDMWPVLGLSGLTAFVSGVDVHHRIKGLAHAFKEQMEDHLKGLGVSDQKLIATPTDPLSKQEVENWREGLLGRPRRLSDTTAKEKSCPSLTRDVAKLRVLKNAAGVVPVLGVGATTYNYMTADPDTHEEVKAKVTFPLKSAFLITRTRHTKDGKEETRYAIGGSGSLAVDGVSINIEIKQPIWMGGKIGKHSNHLRLEVQGNKLIGHLDNPQGIIKGVASLFSRRLGYVGTTRHELGTIGEDGKITFDPRLKIFGWNSLFENKDQSEATTEPKISSGSGVTIEFPDPRKQKTSKAVEE